LGEDIYDVELFKKGLNNMMAGGGFTVLIPPLPKNPKQTKLEVVNSIYSDIMGGSAKESQLGASLAEYLEIRDTWLRFSSLEILKQRWIT
jgi:hypothetical protein